VTKRKEEVDVTYDQGYWVELARDRFTGGVSVGSRFFEGGLGAVLSKNQFGVTGYVQGTLAFLSGRMQIDLLADQTWVPQVAFGIPLQWKQFRIEPHLLWELEKDKPTQPKFGLRLQYQF